MITGITKGYTEEELLEMIVFENEEIEATYGEIFRNGDCIQKKLSQPK